MGLDVRVVGGSEERGAPPGRFNLVFSPFGLRELRGAATVSSRECCGGVSVAERNRLRTQRRNNWIILHRSPVGVVVRFQVIFVDGALEGSAVDEGLQDPVCAGERLVGQTVWPMPTTLEAAVSAVGCRGEGVYVITDGKWGRLAETV